MKDTDGWQRVANSEDLPGPDQITEVFVGGLSFAIVNSGGHYLCFENKCAHQPVKLSEFGEVCQGRLVCHAHGAQFDLFDDGKPLCFPAVESLKSVLLKVAADGVFIKS